MPRVRELIAKVLTLPQAERLPFVLREASDDYVVANAVLAAIDENAGTTTRLDSPSRAVDHSVTLDALAAADGANRLVNELRGRSQAGSQLEVHEEIGRGGMGAVHRAYDRHLRRHLALKVLLDDAPHRLARFLEEAQVNGQLDHPNIVPVHGIGLDASGRAYFTMKWVRGNNLAEVIAAMEAGSTDWNVTRVLSTLLRVCEALAFAHDKGVVHRDIKPANVMVGRFGEVYVMDWGLARVEGHVDSHDIRVVPAELGQHVRTDRRDSASSTPFSPLVTMDGDVVGTPAFMSPEQAEGEIERVGPRSDIYSVGAMLYRLIGGRDPYSESGRSLPAREILARVRSGPPPGIATFRDDVPAELIAIQEKAMARRLEDRYSSMLDLASDLRAYLEHRVVAAYETGALAELKKWVRRNPVIAAAAGILIAVITVAAGVVAAKNVEIASQKQTVEQRERDLSARKAEFDQLAGVVLLQTAREEADSLYPPRPEMVTEMHAWLENHATPLAALIPTLQATLAVIEQRAASPNGSGSVEIQDASQRFLHHALSGLVIDLEQFQTQDVTDVHRRLEWAKRIESLTLNHPNARTTWDAATTALAKADGVTASKLYAKTPINLTPQLGLVPIGMNPVTLLWEFYDLRSACDLAADQDPATLEIPTHDETGRITVTDDTGIVFVLVPGGSFRMGAQSEDPDQPNYDPLAKPQESPPHEVHLDPYFIARHELTQGQWYRLTNGEAPSYHKVGSTAGNDPEVTATSPVENVTWIQADDTLRRGGLNLPTDAQWEYAARAGTNTPWFTGDEPSSLFGFANVFDLHAKSAAPNAGIQVGDFDDGFLSIAPVGTYAPNPFGLYDVAGNAFEWVRDPFHTFEIEARLGDGLRASSQAESDMRTLRNGSAGVPATDARSATRNALAPDSRYYTIGVRAGRLLEGHRE